MECCRPPFASQAEAEADAVADILQQIRNHGKMTDEWLGAVREQ